MTLILPYPDFVNGTTADADQVDANFAAIVAFVNGLETSIANKLSKTGGTMTGDINMSGDNTVTHMRDGTAPGEAISLTQFLTAMEGYLPIGARLIWGGQYAPNNNFLLCDGTTFNTTFYPELYALLGTNVLPDLRRKVLVGAGNGMAVGATGGSETVSLGITEIPSHNHSLTDPGHAHAITDTGHSHPQYVSMNVAGTASTIRDWSAAIASTISLQGCNTGSVYTGVTINSHATGVTLANAGGGDGHSNMQPYTVVNFIIKAK